MATVTLRPNADGTYSRFVEVPNSGFVFGDQFESNDLSLWTSTLLGGATFATSADVAHGGTYSGKAAGLALAGEYAQVYKQLDASYATLYVRSYVRFATLFDSGVALLTALFDTAPAGVARIALDKPNNKWGIFNEHLGSYYWEAATSTINANTQYRIELRITVSGTVGVAQLWVDDVLKVDQSNIDTGTTNLKYVICGVHIFNNQAAERISYHDCVVVSTSGPIGVEARYNLVNDSSDNTSLQVTTSLTQKETENLADSADLGTINSVTAYARAKYVTGGGNEGFKIIWKLAATEVQSAEKTPAAGFGDHTDVRATDPDGGAWSWADVNALEIGVIASTLGAGEVLWFSEFYIVVDYTAAGGGQQLFTLINLEDY